MLGLGKGLQHTYQLVNISSFCLRVGQAQRFLSETLDLNLGLTTYHMYNHCTSYAVQIQVLFVKQESGPCPHQRIAGWNTGWNKGIKDGIFYYSSLRVPSALIFVHFPFNLFIYPITDFLGIILLCLACIKMKKGIT